MLKRIFCNLFLVAGALPLATLIRLCKNKISVAMEYISAMLVHTMIFTLCVWHMSDLMAGINRVDFFGVINDNPIIMMAYYIKSLGGISQANAVCVVVPLFFYVAVVFAMAEIFQLVKSNWESINAYGQYMGLFLWPWL